MLIGNYFKDVNINHKKHFFSGLSFNSFECKKNDIFFAIKGSLIDGTKYIKSAINQGARTIVYDENFEGLKDGVLYIKSRNVRKTLSKISYKFYKHKPKNLIAVTGTNGKSSIAEFYFQILELNKKKVASIGTLGIKTLHQRIPVLNTTLDPINLAYHLSRLKKKKIENVILEASSHGIKQHRLDGLEFSIGIFTNLSHDHLDYHKNFSDYLNSKLYLFKELLKKKSNIITDKEIKEYKKIQDISLKKKIGLSLISNDKTGLSIVSHQYEGEKQMLRIRYKKKYYNICVNLIGKIQIKNIFMSIIAAEKSGLDITKIINIIHKLKPVEGRLEKIGNIRNRSCVILDYAHTPEALKACIINIKDQFKNKKVHIVFGCGGDRDKFKRTKMGKIVNKYCDKIYLTDDNPRSENPKKIRNEIKKEISKIKLKEIASREKAIKTGVMDLLTGDILIVAGKGHENIQEYKGVKKVFSDRKIILQTIKKKNAFLSKDIKLNILKEISKKKDFPIKKKIKDSSINSKEIKKNDIFFAIKGKNNDGHSYLKEVFQKKASFAIIEKNQGIKNKRNQIRVKNTLSFLTKVSSILRENLNSKIIAITGSCGKTSLKELLGSSLKKISKTTYSPKSFNNRYGVPLSLFNLKQNDNFGVFEIGMDKKGEIKRLSQIIKPDIGVITNISYAHIKNFKNIKEIAYAKAEIIDNIKEDGLLVLNKDDKFFKLHKKIALKKNITIKTFSIKNKDANISLDNIKKIGKKYKINFRLNSNKYYFYFSSYFENDIKNLLAAITVISEFKNIKTLHKNFFYSFKKPQGRGDKIKITVNKKKIFLIDESYNSNPLSLNSAIKNFDQLEIDNKRKHLILGDMLELGKHSKKLHSAISVAINNSSINKVHIFGKNIKNTYKNIINKKKGWVINAKPQIFNLIKNDINNNDYLMIKGSKSTGLNSFTNFLRKKTTDAL